MKIKVCNRILFFLCVAALFFTGINRVNREEKIENNNMLESNPSQNRCMSGRMTDDSKAEDVNRPGSIKIEQGEKKVNPSNYVRVLVKSQNFEHAYHDQVILQFNSETTVEETETIFHAGEKIHLDNTSSMINTGESITLIPVDETMGFTLLSLTRAQGNPTYEGQIIIYRTKDGYQIINYVELETYLCYVIPSEMPSGYEQQALAAQAICARTYAWRKMQEGSEGEGVADGKADVDDSVMYQVYNNIERGKSTDEAVAETKGIIMTCEGSPITAYFFSTSSGSTSTNEVWSQEPVEYLQCVSTGTLEAQDPWYRWEVSFTMEELTRRARDYGIEDLQTLEIIDKSDGGAVTSLKLRGVHEEYTLLGELGVREFLKTKDIAIKRHDGTVVCDMDILPSAYISLEYRYDEQGEEICLIKGGGYGHGVGMSQNGANHLAQQGRTWDEILHYFYRKIDLDSIL